MKTTIKTITLQLLVLCLILTSLVVTGASQAETTQAAGITNTSCTAINTLTNSTYKITPPGGNGPCYGVYSCGYGASGSSVTEVGVGQYSTCTNPVTGAPMPAGYSCKNGLSVDGIGGISARWLPQTMIPCARMDAPARPDPRGGGPIILNWNGASISRDGCWTVLDYGFSKTNGGFATVAGTACGATDTQPFCFLDCSSRGTTATTNTGSQTGSNGGSSSTDCNIPGASIRKNNPALFAPVRCVSLNGNQIEGWVFNPDTANSPLKIRVYGKKAGVADQTFIKEYTAGSASADLSNSPALKQIEGGVNHGFSIPVPAGYTTGDTILIFAVNTVDANGWNILIKEINL